MFVIKSNNSEKKSLSNRDFFISKKYNKRRILTSNRKRDWEFYFKKIFILNSSFSLLSKLDGRGRSLNLLYLHVLKSCQKFSPCYMYM